MPGATGRDTRGTVYLDARGRPCVTARETARRLSLGLPAIRAAIRTGRLPATRAGTWYNAEWLVPVDAIGQWTTRRPPRGEPPRRRWMTAWWADQHAKWRLVETLIGAPPGTLPTRRRASPPER